MLGLCCCTSFSLVVASGGCSLVEVHWLLFSVASLAGAQAMGLWVLVVVALRLESTGSVVLVHRWHVGSSRIRDRTFVPCTGRRILYH